jgi:hypothetical protein
VEVFAFGSLGLLLGIVLCLLSFSAFLLYRAATTQRELSLLEAKRMGDLAQENFRAIDALRLEVSAALTKLDAAQLHESAIQIQRSGARLARTVAMLYKLALSQDGSAAIAAEELAEEDISPYSGKPYAGDMHTQGDMGQEDALAYQEHLRQRAREKQQADVITSRQKPLPDIEEGFELDAAENLAAFRPEGF